MYMSRFQPQVAMAYVTLSGTITAQHLMHNVFVSLCRVATQDQVKKSPSGLRRTRMGRKFFHLPSSDGIISPIWVCNNLLASALPAA
jgi:hypothetical protein